ncbi:uncharacterized protein LOC116352634 [Contarinia nasturtii]|uniref:uncharacterized protein LOC116352634 n=1 Tax=Contarinia nasturtii TaxID=265458 RepID=UPI0012D37408|nr:uncharacterized protein LOC116352634 [Contarinia nasturtii]
MNSNLQMQSIDSVEQCEDNTSNKDSNNYSEQLIPAYDSPKNILNILNDHCIQEIFTHLSVRFHFLNVAEVCKKFQENVIKCFPEHLKKTEFYSSNFRGMHPNRTSSFLRIFGHLIKEINLDYCPIRSKITPSDYHRLGHFELITSYCTKNLIELKIENSNDVDLNLDINITKSSQFQVLEKLSIKNCTLTKFGTFPKLKDLSLFEVKLENCDWLTSRFPQLEKLYVHRVRGLNHELFVEFQKNNPKLKNMTIAQSISSFIFRNIEVRLPNLEKLTYSSGSFVDKTPE